MSVVLVKDTNKVTSHPCRGNSNIKSGYLVLTLINTIKTANFNKRISTIVPDTILPFIRFKNNKNGLMVFI